MAKVFSYTKAALDDLFASHTHLAAKITDFANAAKDVVGSMIVAVGGGYDAEIRAITLPPPPNATTTTNGAIRLAGHLGGTADSPTVRSATDAVNGVVELATAAETSTGEDSTRAVTPAGLKTAMSNRPSSATVTTIWTGTQAAYDAISPKDSATLYFIK